MNSIQKRNLRGHLISQQGGCCAYCSKPITADRSTIDHVIPLSQGGPNRKLNLLAVCEPCNAAKGPSYPSLYQIGRAAHIKGMSPDAYIEKLGRVK